MGIYGDCSEIFADIPTLSGYAGNCIAYQVQSGDSWASIVNMFYGTENSEDVDDFAECNNADGAAPGTPEIGWWLWLPANLATASLSCTNVEPPCSSITESQLNYFNPVYPPSSGMCDY
ncbi:LysM domain-containing protein [Sulfobacillus sp. hq2]|uniref:LysM peptidoglycan-binding domain-containing protein n=1 Tax=Sulfobacillus sp. hq2 TaxID=2039167 RepID=UPI000CD1523A|nr:LysM domain-containing protein [Sulfobacillus sp. hq2]POB11422.1 hypothetical protein CO251_04575 [Sulfobacillus sp. hq2]